MTIAFPFCLGGGFKPFLFSPLFGEDSHFDSYFSDGWFNHQPVVVETSGWHLHLGRPKDGAAHGVHPFSGS